MQGTQKIVGVFVLTTFAFVAGSVVCLASGQPSAMTDCGNQMNAAAMCPFMSVSIPTTTAASFGKTMSVILLLTLLVIAAIGVAQTDRREVTTLSRYWHSPNRPPRSFLDPALNLISQGILHSRAFGF